MVATREGRRQRSRILEMMRSLVQSNREGLCLGEARETSLSKKEATVRVGCGGKMLESRASCLWRVGGWAISLGARVEDRVGS